MDDITGIRTDIAEIKTHISYIRSKLDDGREQFKEIDKRCEAHHRDIEKKFEPLNNFKNKIIGIAMFVSACISLIVSFFVGGNR